MHVIEKPVDDDNKLQDELNESGLNNITGKGPVLLKNASVKRQTIIKIMNSKTI